MKAVLFDMDGVLVDVTRSYRMTIKKTIEHFSNKEISFSRIQSYKNRGGLNNDWDLTEYILADFRVSIEKQKIIEIFQEIYLGKNYDGLIKNEKWLLDVGHLETIKRKFKIGIVTGRPRNEARFVLKRFGVQNYFPVLITMDDIPRERAKPDPYGITLALKELKTREGFYIGDTVDDMIAAREANVAPIGVSVGQKDGKQRDILLDSGAQKVLHNINNLMEVLE